MSLPTPLHTVALVGRPNVGKSTLYNRLLKRRLAVVSEVAGTTRDRLKEVIRFGDTSFVLMDMAGIEPALTEKNEISVGMQHQVEQALAEASLIIWVVDGVAGATPQDKKVAELLRRLHKPIVVAVNKCDHESHLTSQYEFAQFGFEPYFPLSAIHGRGIIELLNAVTDTLKDLPVPERTEEVYDDGNDRELRLAILGRPNVGKSTLLNVLCGEDRAVVSPISGTTRDSVDTRIAAADFFGKTFTKFQQVRIIDTAGIRQRSKMGHTVEAWSVLRSLDTLDFAQVALWVIDSMENMTHQDLVVAQRIMDAGRPLIIVANKWDAYLEKKGIIPGTTEADVEQELFQNRLLYKAPFLIWTQLIFVSAKTGFNVEYLGKVVLRAYLAWSHVYPQELLDTLTTELAKSPRLKKLKSITFEHAEPPVFIIHMTQTELPHFTTRRFIERALRDYLDIGPTPIKLWVDKPEFKHRKKK